MDDRLRKMCTPWRKRCAWSLGLFTTTLRGVRRLVFEKENLLTQLGGLVDVQDRHPPDPMRYIDRHAAEAFAIAEPLRGGASLATLGAV